MDKYCPICLGIGWVGRHFDGAADPMAIEIRDEKTAVAGEIQLRRGQL